MAYDHYFVNDTKKQIISSKTLDFGYERGIELALYLSMCVNDTIRILGEENEFIKKHIFDPDFKSDYRYIEIDYFMLQNFKGEEEQQDYIYDVVLKNAPQLGKTFLDEGY